MEQEGLFGPTATPVPAGTLGGHDEQRSDAPLPVRMRPRALDELIGQEHLLGPGTPMRRHVELDQPMAQEQWGPTGPGKTTMESVLSRSTPRTYVDVSTSIT